MCWLSIFEKRSRFCVRKLLPQTRDIKRSNFGFRVASLLGKMRHKSQTITRDFSTPSQLRSTMRNLGASQRREAARLKNQLQKEAQEEKQRDAMLKAANIARSGICKGNKEDGLASGTENSLEDSEVMCTPPKGADLPEDGKKTAVVKY